MKSLCQFSLVKRKKKNKTQLKEKSILSLQRAMREIKNEKKIMMWGGTWQTLIRSSRSKKMACTCESARSLQSVRFAKADPNRAGVHKCRNMQPKNR